MREVIARSCGDGRPLGRLRIRIVYIFHMLWTNTSTAEDVLVTRITSRLAG